MKTRTFWGLSLITALIVGAGAIHAASPSEVETATFAGGCFWCVEADFDKVEGVISTTSGYIGGHKKNPTYKQVSAGGTGHTEAVQIVYDPAKVTYAELLKVLWRNIDPTTPNRQFCDAGSQYRAEIFHHNERQKDLAEQSKREVESTKQFEAPIVTQITMASAFYPAEEYHQDYYLKNPIRYKIYRYGCGRDKRLKQLWG
ncbi:MAG: peptide-methionine (S)-S-oxide reductase [Proteobacteria bacterium]|nr:MAG: peptide-methionine (S)-S-oxide reductase [Pseudomonadota bacterium]